MITEDVFMNPGKECERVDVGDQGRSEVIAQSRRLAFAKPVSVCKIQLSLFRDVNLH